MGVMQLGEPRRANIVSPTFNRVQLTLVDYEPSLLLEKKKKKALSHVHLAQNMAIYPNLATLAMWIHAVVISRTDNCNTLYFALSLK